MLNIYDYISYEQKANVNKVKKQKKNSLIRVDKNNKNLTDQHIIIEQMVKVPLSLLHKDIVLNSKFSSKFPV